MWLKFQLVGDEPAGYFTSVAKELNLGLLRTNPASGQGRTYTQGLRNYKSSSLTAQPHCIL